MATKEDFVGHLKDDGLSESWLTRSAYADDLPTFSDADEAVMAIAAYCENLNRFLQVWNDVPLIDYLLRGTQRSSCSIAGVLSGVEAKTVDPLM